MLDEELQDITLLLDKYRGSLEWLVALSREKEVDLKELSVQPILEQILPILRESLQDINFSIYVTSLLSQILELKLREIFPDLESLDEEEQGASPLDLDGLLLYKGFREKAQGLDRLYREQMRRWTRLEFNRKWLSHNLLSGEMALEERVPLSLWNLAKVYYRKMAEIQVQQTPVPLKLEEYSLEEVLEKIEEKLSRLKETTFYQLSEEEQNLAMVVYTFLALLELYKRGTLEFLQEKDYADFLIKVREEISPGEAIPSTPQTIKKL